MNDLPEDFDPNETMADLVHRAAPVEVLVKEDGLIEIITKGGIRYYDPNDSPFPPTSEHHKCWIVGDVVYYPKTDTE